MGFIYIIFGLTIGILGVVVFWKLIKHYNYELNFKESLLSAMLTLILTIVLLVDFNLLNIYFDVRIIIGIIIYFLALLLIYYVIRSLKLKKYIPLKTIISYILISGATLGLLSILIDKTTNIDGWDALGFVIIYMFVYGGFVATLLLQNVLMFIVNLLSKNKQKFKNINYKFSKVSYISILVAILIIGLIFLIDYYNEHNYNRMLEKQKEIVIDYLNSEYPNQKFEINDTFETRVDCGMFGCHTPAIRNKIVNKTFEREFIIDIKIEDLTIYEDGFKDIYKEEVKKYLNDMYNVSLSYQIKNQQLVDVEFIINRNYKKEDISLFTNDIKNIFNYVDNNFYDIDYVVLNFKNGNPFYEGEYEYSKTKGSIKENSMTNELWIMVNNEYIFVEK